MKQLVLSVIIFSLSLGVFADDTNKDTLKVKNPKVKENVDSLIQESLQKLDNQETADEILNSSQLIEQIDSLAYIRFFSSEFFTTDTSNLNVYNFPKDSVPVYSDSIYAARMAALDLTTPIDITYNKTVKNFIHLYSVRKRDLTSRIMGLSEIYFPMFEEHLDKYNIPLELKYLAVVESALHPRAGSRAGAKGLWQFMYYTGKTYGLNVSSLIDDRYDPLKSTIAACEHLQDLYEIYDDWLLAMAAYNSGPGNVNKAIRRAGRVKNYWAVWPFLPRETRGYVPGFMAVMYVMNYSAEHNIYPQDPGILYNGIDTVHVSDLLHFDQVSEMFGIPYEDVDFLNPQYKEDFIPASKENKMVLRLPREFAGDFVEREEEVYAYKTKRGIEKEQLQKKLDDLKNRNVHIVRSGETLGHIAGKYNTSVSNIKRWNGLRSDLIRPGQRLIVYANPNYNRSTFVKSSGKYHTVRSGETLGLIASKYNISITQLKQWNNLSSSRIYVNQKLVISN